MKFVRGAGQGVYQLCTLFNRLIEDESAITSIEYAMIAVLIAIVIVGAVTALGTKLSTMFTNISTSI